MHPAPLALLLLCTPHALACEPATGFPVGTDSSQDSAAEEALPPLPDIEAWGPVAPEQWKVAKFLPGASSDTITLMKRERDYTIEDTIVEGSCRTAVICYQGGGPYRGLTIRNSILRVVPGTLPLDRSYWAFRGYDMIDTRLERVEITNFGRITHKHDEGHAIYLNIKGPLTLEDCNIHHNGGQGLQLVNRPPESVLPPGPATGAITIRRTSFRENGFNPDRGATQVSIFGTGQEILMEDVLILAGHDETEYSRDRTGGGLLIEMEGYDRNRPEKGVWWRPAKLPEDFEIPFAQGRTLLRRVGIFQKNPNRPIVQIKGCEELIVRNCWFGAGRIVLDHPKKPGRNCGRIVWEGNHGTAEVIHRGRRLGTASEDFVIE
jgi:hypothetical protein